MNLPRLLLMILPQGFRRQYGEDMLLTLTYAARDQDRAGARLKFWARELWEWTALALRLHARGEEPEPCPDTGQGLDTLLGGRRGLIAVALSGAVAGLVFWLGGQLVGSHGIYWRSAHPVVVLVVFLAGVAIGWEHAAPHRAGRRLRRLALLAVVLLSALPAFQLVDHLYLNRAAGAVGPEFSLPGITLRSIPLSVQDPVPAPGPIEGFQATRIHQGHSGRRLFTVWERRPGAPPYLWFGVMMLISVAMASHSLRMRAMA